MSFNDRVKRLIEQNDQASIRPGTAAAEAAARAQQDENQLLQIRDKWVADSRIIADILQKLEKMLEPIGAKFRTVDAGPRGDFFQQMAVTGTVGKKPVSFTIGVTPSGEVRAINSTSYVSTVTIVFHDRIAASIFETDLTAYENAIMNQIEQADRKA